VCKTPKVPKPTNAAEETPILLTRNEALGFAGTAGKRRSDVRLDLNNATQRFQGLMIPNG